MVPLRCLAQPTGRYERGVDVFEIGTVIRKFANRRLPVSIRNNNMGAVSIMGDVEGAWSARQPGFVGVTPRPGQ